MTVSPEMNMLMMEPQACGPTINTETHAIIPMVITPRMKCNASLAIGNSLAQRLENWQQCGASQWVLQTIAQGYKLQFAMRPPTFETVVFSHAEGQAADILQAEIVSLLDKKAIREVPKHQSMNGFYSRYFLVKKKGVVCVLYWTFEPSINT